MSEKTSANRCPPEILAPAGDYDAFLSAIKGGADAVYLGIGEFNARRGAKNLSSRELEKAIDMAHSHGVKVYLAFNIPIKEHELQPALDLIDQAYAAGVDAIILRDPGLFRLLKATFPGLPLHASTQMTIHNKAGVRFVEELGASRVIVSRELSTAEVRDIVDSSKIGIEVFVHGALCYSYSGRCLFSSFVSDRSGNLGACAQPCRWKYELFVDGEPQNELIRGDYPLSCAELCTLPGLDKIVASGVESLKIEGRMKKPEYVTGSSAIYKEAVERICKRGENLDREELEQKEKELAKLFSRGFTRGFILGDRAVTHLEYDSNYGVYLGKVSNVVRSKPYGLITLTLHEEIEVNDGIGIHTQVNTKTGMLGSIVNGIISKNGKHVEKAKKGEKVTLEISFKTGEVVNPQDEVFLSTDRSFLEGLQEMKLKPLPVNIKVKARKGERLKVTVESPGESPVELEDEYVVQPSLKSPTTEEAIRKAMEQLGETPYDVGSIEIEADEEIFIPVGALKSARRQALELLLEKSTGIRKKELRHPQLSDLTHLCKNEAEDSQTEVSTAEVSMAEVSMAEVSGAEVS
ncbi:TPA: U32 family peptidase, partial [Methanosarcinaceae archaeon]|nr:U32 family peptidase [Methanosarcinaceae archaeon]